jgi:hypothetical protein
MASMPLSSHVTQVSNEDAMRPLIGDPRFGREGSKRVGVLRAKRPLWCKLLHYAL